MHGKAGSSKPAFRRHTDGARDGPASGACEDPFPKAPTITNELANLNELNIKGATPVKSIVGVVTYFCNLHLSPRSPADVQIN